MNGSGVDAARRPGMTAGIWRIAWSVKGATSLETGAAAIEDVAASVA